MKLTVKFHYSREYPGSMWWAYIKDTLESTMVRAWNQVCDYTNPRLNTWNQEFETLHPDKDGRSDEYTDFMRQKYSPIIDKLNRESIYPEGLLIEVTYKLGSDLELIQIVTVDGKPLTEMYFTLVEAPD